MSENVPDPLVLRDAWRSVIHTPASRLTTWTWFCAGYFAANGDLSKLNERYLEAGGQPKPEEGS